MFRFVRRSFHTTRCVSAAEVKIISMPRLSPTMEIGNVKEWKCKENDIVPAYNLIMDIETRQLLEEGSKVDKAKEDVITLQIETQDPIKILKLLTKPGVDVACGTPLAYAIDEFDLDDAGDITKLQLPVHVTNTYTENLGPDQVVTWQAFMKKEKSESDTPGCGCS